MIAADAGLPVVQALVRWDPAGFAARELAERVEVRLPPAARLAALTGSPAAVAELVALAQLPDPHELIGPMPVGDADGEQHRLLIRVPREAGGALAARAAPGRRASIGAQGARSGEGGSRSGRVVLIPKLDPR